MGNSSAREQHVQEDVEDENSDDGSVDSDIFGVSDSKGDAPKGAQSSARPSQSAAPILAGTRSSREPLPPAQAPSQATGGAKVVQKPKADKAPIDFSKLMAAKAKAAKSKSGTKPAASQDVGAAVEIEAEAPTYEEFELGEEGAIWEAIEDAVVRDGRDVKSAKVGVIQSGERCTQMAPWRFEQKGRIWMQVCGPKGVAGWLAADSSKCRNAEGGWGTRALQLIEMPQMQHVSADPTLAKVQATKGDDLEDLLDMFGGEEPEAPPEPVKKTGAKSAWRKQRAAEATAQKTVEEPEMQAEDEADDAAVQGDAKTDQQELTETERKLRTVKKKLRELEDKPGREAQCAQLVQARICLEEAVAAETRAVNALESTGTRKRKKKPATAKNASSSGTGKQRGTELDRFLMYDRLLTFLPLVIVTGAMAFYYYYLA